MKYTSPRRDNLFPDALGVGNPVVRRLINAVSPSKLLLQDLASGQANIGTPMRSRVNSQDSRVEGFPNLKCHQLISGKYPNIDLDKCEETLINDKRGAHFQSPALNLRKAATDSHLFAMDSVLGPMQLADAR